MIKRSTMYKATTNTGAAQLSVIQYDTSTYIITTLHFNRPLYIVERSPILGGLCLELIMGLRQQISKLYKEEVIIKYENKNVTNTMIIPYS